MICITTMYYMMKKNTKVGRNCLHYTDSLTNQIRAEDAHKELFEDNELFNYSDYDPKSVL